MAEEQKTFRRYNSQKKDTALDLGKLQPQDTELEEAILGALMLEKELLFCFLKRQWGPFIWGLNEGRESTIQKQQMWSNSVQQLPATYRSFFLRRKH